MTIAIVDSKYIFGEGIIDLNAVIAKLKQYECIVDKCCAELKRA